MDGIIKSVKVQCEGLEQKVDEVFRGIKFSEPGKFLAEAQTKSRSLAKMHVENDTVYGDYNKITSVIKQEQAELGYANRQESAFEKVNSENLTADNTANQQVEQLTDHKDELESLRAQVDQLKAEKSVDTKKSSKLKTAVKVVGTMAAALGVPVALLLAKKNPFESLPLLRHMIEFLEKNGSNGLTFK